MIEDATLHLPDIEAFNTQPFFKALLDEVESIKERLGGLLDESDYYQQREDDVVHNPRYSRRYEEKREYHCNICNSKAVQGRRAFYYYCHCQRCGRKLDVDVYECCFPCDEITMK